MAPSKPAPAPAAGAAAVPRPPKPPKGHRQKGAGTMVVSKGEVQRDGLEMKEWQKSPKQLLKEYCQAERRPLPRYVPSGGGAGGKVLFRVVLPDAKDQKEKDLTFVPKDASFDTQVEAEHAVALLALAKLDGPRAHEMKLPEPYKTAWLGLVGRKATVAAGADASAAAAFPCPSCSKSFAKAHALEHHQKKEHPVVPGSSTATPPPAATPPPPPTPAAVVAPTTLRPPVQPAAESLSNLQTSSKFTSQQERRLAEEERARKHNLRTSNVNRNAHNEDEMFMSEDNRSAVERIVREANDWLQAGGHDDEEEEAETANGDAVDGLVRQLTKLGFGERDARSALEQGKARTVSSALDWLLLNLNETSLPTAFDPRGLQLEVVKNAASSASSTTSKKAASSVAFPGKHATWREVRAWADANQPTPVSTTAAAAEGDDYDTLAAILGEDHVTLLPPSEEDAGAVWLRLLVGVNAALHPSEAVSLDVCPATRQLVVRGLINDELAQQCTLHLYTEMQASVLPGEPVAYFAWDQCRNNMTSKPSLVVKRAAKQQQPQQQPQQSKKASSAHGRAHRPVPVVDAQHMAQQSRDLEAHLARRPKLASREQLPAHRYKDEIISALAKHRVVIVKGETGCGKTTQVPQFVLEHLISTGQGGRANIIVTQPRRLAAISVAQRVADEFGGRLGEEVGYRVQLDSKVSAKLTRLEFCTTGLLLRRLEFLDSGSFPVTHIFVDEIHERSLDSDFLLAVLKHQVLAKRPDVKLVLMSATVDADRFVRYFAGEGEAGVVPVLQIPGRTFPVRELYLEDLAVRRNHDEGEDYYHFVARCVREAHETATAGNPLGSILVFMSGVNEINRTIAACNALYGDGEGSCPLLLMGLHGGSPTGQNQQVFAKAPKGRRKVVVCTNVCETSITIPDCVLVIDTGKAKEVRYDADNKFSSLEEDWISLANANQRKGRAGRVQAGECWRLFSRNKELAQEQLAEVHRVPLDNIVLSVAHHLRHENEAGGGGGGGDVVRFFHSLIEPPNERNVRSAVDTLVDINALQPAAGGALFKLTPLGQHLVKLPMDAQLGKLLVYGSLMSVPRELAIVCAALCRNKSVFLPPAAAASVDGAKKLFDAGAQSDHLAIISAFERWAAEPTPKAKKDFCQQHGLDAQALREVGDLVGDFLSNLDRIGFDSGGARTKGDKSSSMELTRRKRIKACLCVLAPQVLRIRKPRKRYVQVSGGAVETEDYDSKEIRFYPLRSSSTAGEGEQQGKRVYIHPSSVNSKATSFYSNYMVYSSLMQTSMLFARDCTCVSPYGLVLFASTQLEVRHETGELVCDGGKMTFKCGARVGVLLKEIKKLLDLLLEAKIDGGGEGGEVSTGRSVALHLSHSVMEACTKLVEGDGFNN